MGIIGSSFVWYSVCLLPILSSDFGLLANVGFAGLFLGVYSNYNFSSPLIDAIGGYYVLRYAPRCRQKQ